MSYTLKFCPICGSKVSPTDKRCQFCGIDLEDEKLKLIDILETGDNTYNLEEIRGLFE